MDQNASLQEPSLNGISVLLKAMPAPLRTAIETASHNERGLIHSAGQLPHEIFEPMGDGWWRLHPALFHSMSHSDQQIEADIFTHINAGDYERALKLFSDLGGDLLIFLIGAVRTQAIINAFPRHVIDEHKTLQVTELILAYKAGHFPRGEYLLRTHYGIEVFLLDNLLADKERWSLAEREAFLLVSIYRGLSYSEECEALILDMLGEAEIDDHFSRGRIYNCLLVDAMQNDRFDLARSYAHHAATHYQKAKTPYLEFFVQFHLSTIFILYGEPVIAQNHLSAAQSLLAQCQFDTSGEERMLHLMEAIINFESGSSKRIQQFLQRDLQEMTAGESWPHLSTITMTYAARTAFEQSGFPKAQELLSYFRVNEWRSVRYDANLNRLEADIMQSSGRWMLARDVLRSVQSRVNANWTENATGDALMRLRDPMEIDLSLSWLRDESWHQPSHRHLLARLQGLVANPYISPSQRVQCNIMIAYIWKKMGMNTDAKRLFSSVLEKRGSLLALLSVRVFVDELIKKSDIRSHIELYPQAKETLARLNDVSKRSTKNFLSELTTQENRVLESVAEGASNKETARILDLSVATVKFHMTNIMRKLEVASRAEAAKIYSNRARRS